MSNTDELCTAAETSLPTPTIGECDSTVDLLVARHPEYADGIRSNDRLAGALAATESATKLSPQMVVDRISDRELATAQRPVDVLVSRCLALIRETSESHQPEASPKASHTTDAALAEDDSPASELVAPSGAPIPHPDPTQRIGVEQQHVHARTSWRQQMRRERRVAIPAGADSNLVKWPFEGHRYITVVGSVGGAGSTTVTMLLGHILASLRSDNVSVVDAAAHGGALAFRAGTESGGTIADLLSAEADVTTANDLGRYVDRLPTRLAIAKTLPGDAPVNADDYRRLVDLLARHFDILITDRGTEMSHDAGGPAIGLADLVVVVTNPTEHGLCTTARTLDGLEGLGVEPERTILVVNGVHRRSAMRADRFGEAFGQRCAAHLWLPWDQHLCAGSAVSLPQAHRSTIKAAVRLSAAVVQSMSPAPPAGANRQAAASS